MLGLWLPEDLGRCLELLASVSQSMWSFAKYVPFKAVIVLNSSRFGAGLKTGPVLKLNGSIQSHSKGVLG